MSEKLHRNEDGTLPAYAWPGGYPLIYLCADGGTLCPDCANGQNGSKASEDKDTPADWRLVAADIHYEGPPAVCDHCGAEVDSAYGDPEQPEDEPTEDDITTQDHEKFYQYGRLVLERDRRRNECDARPEWYAHTRVSSVLLGSFGDDHEAAIRAYMEREQFWPNVWFISDHGNAHRMDLTPATK